MSTDQTEVVSPLPADAQSASPSSACSELPAWFPAPDDWQKQSPELRQASVEILSDVYRELVVHAPSQLQRSTARSLVHMLWFELITQNALVKPLLQLNATRYGIDADWRYPTKLINHYFHLMRFKNDAVRLLALLPKLEALPARSSSLPAPPPQLPDAPESLLPPVFVLPDSESGKSTPC